MQHLVFIGGMERSGANMLRRALDSHPQVASGPETSIIEAVTRLYSAMTQSAATGHLSSYLTEAEMKGTISNLVENIYQPYAHRKNATVIVDCTPRNIWSFPLLADLFPSAKFINIIRDGRDVACSYRDIGARAQKLSRELDPISQTAATSIERCAAIWAETVRFGWDHCGPDSSLARAGRAFTTFYENIVMSPESQMRHICDFLGLEFSRSMLHPERENHDAVIDEVFTLQSEQNMPLSLLSAGRWIDHLSLKDRIVFYARGHIGLRIAGYDDSVNWLFRAQNVSVDTAFEALETARHEILGEGIKSRTDSGTARSSGASSSFALEKLVSGPAISGSADRVLPEIEAMLRIAKQNGAATLQG